MRLLLGGAASRRDAHRPWSSDLCAYLALPSAGTCCRAGLSVPAPHCAPHTPCQEDDLRAGLLLEQAAHCLLALQPPHVRKFAFHLVLAGLRYDMCGQRSLAHRAYK